MGARGTTRQVLGGISMLVGILVVAVSAWLLVVANNEGDCAGYDRNRIRNEYEFGYGGSSGYGGYSGTNSLNSFDRYGPSYNSRRRYDAREGGTRSREYFCVYIVDKWVSASWITLSAGIFQVIISLAFVIAAWGDNAYTAPKIWTICWAVCHIIFLAAVITGLALVLATEFFEHYQTRSSLGAVYVGGLGIDIFVCLLLPLMALLLVLRRLRVNDVDSFSDRPNSRTEFLRQQQQLQQQRSSPAKEAHV